MHTAAIVVAAWLGGSLLLGLLVGRFIHAGHSRVAPTPPQRVGDPTTYQRSKARR